ncbi:MAG: Crp/Fnr family transcriptional regulator [Bacteroidota bacterium]
MTFTDEEADLIRKEDIIQNYSKNYILPQQGAIAQHCFLVLKGCVKRYYLDNGVERIVDFYTENDPITPVSYVDKKPSQYFLSCVEPCIISKGTEESTQRFLERFPKFVPIFVQIGDRLAAKQQLQLDDFKNLAPEERYQKLLEERPNLVNRVPQYMIASYLGIQPESLSRIRKRLWKS